MKKIALIVLSIVAVNLLFAEEKTEKPSFQIAIENAFVQQGQQFTWGQQTPQGVDAAAAVNGTWQVQYQIQTVVGVAPYSATETWRYDARQGIFYDGSGWMWRGKTAGSYLQVRTQLVTGAPAMMTVQFLSNNEAVGNINVSGTRNLSPVMSQIRAIKVQ